MLVLVLTGNELGEDTAAAPDVDGGLVLPLLQKDLGRPEAPFDHVLRQMPRHVLPGRSQFCQLLRQVLSTIHFLRFFDFGQSSCKTEIAEVDPTIFIEKYIFWCEVPMNNVGLMDEIETT